MGNRNWFWLSLGMVFYCLVPYVLITTAMVALEFDRPVVYQIGNVLALWLLLEAALSVITPFSIHLERFNVWHWRKILFITIRT
jgi:uncharacterized Tic20 family protein